ncbi:hypothetical protein PHSY_000414 [Pseudozyma hubeiensis SY62]|uniref:Uncharacterized protein n=1 Tax=Pseudozyma hubeiensis (strain SY62) TaxID=1305764 RepID=R9NWL7_PSEHS|nr:hypothetical protein PHSY_000414 [Pseudozyma hubeiensis SY62]GAC92857.1 hypothetical protein PHSY_000414 [Pseudozyma hubeiensis SY62]
MPSDINDKNRRSGDHSHSSRRTHDPSTSSSSRSQSARARSPSPSTSISLPFDASPLTSDDYFIRSSEFKHWLSSSKQLYLDEISSASARRYFDRFVRRWNAGRLDDPYYSGTIRSLDSSAGKTRHKWSFTTHQGYASEKAKLELMKDSIDTLTNGDSRGAREARDAERRTKRSHNTEDSERGSQARPSTVAQRQFDREHQRDLDRISSSQDRKRLRQDAADMAEEQEGKSTGRERTMEKRREINADKRAFAESRRPDGLELDDRDIYDDERKAGRGDEDARNRGRSKREQARQERLEERKEELQGRVDEMKRKEDKTMDMFKAMARERFGGGSG